MAEEKSMVMFRAQHGVPDFDAWYQAFLDAEQSGLHAGLGVTQSFVSKLEEPDANGNPVVQVIHILPAEYMDDARKKWDMNAPPFVGGPDLIKNGAIIAPITVDYSVIRCALGER